MMRLRALDDGLSLDPVEGIDRQLGAGTAFKIEIGRAELESPSSSRDAACGPGAGAFWPLLDAPHA